MRFLLTACVLFAVFTPVLADPPLPAAESENISQLSNDDLIAQAPARVKWTPPTAEESAFMTELYTRACSGSFTDDQGAQIITLQKLLYTRLKWRSGDNLGVGMRCPEWLGRSALLQATPKIPGALTVNARATVGGHGFTSDRERQRIAYQEVGPGPEPADTVDFDVTLSWEANYPGNKKYHWKGVVSLPVEVVDPFAPILEPVVSPELDAAVASTVVITIGKNYDNPPKTAMWISTNYQPALADHLDKISFCARVEILDGALIRHAGIYDLRTMPRCDGCGLSALVRELTPQEIEDEAVLDRLTIRIRGLPEDSAANLLFNEFGPAPSPSLCATPQ